MLTIIDEYTRECLAIDVARKLNSEDVLERLSNLFISRAVPKYIRSDNGPEFTANNVCEWLKRVEVQTLFIEPGSPWENAFIERWIKSIREQCLNYFIIFGKKHLDHLVFSYLDFYNELCPHQALNNRPLTGAWAEVDEPLLLGEQIVCHERLGGLLRHYERIAA